MCTGRECEVREIRRRERGGREGKPRSKVGAERWAVTQAGKVGKVSRTGSGAAARRLCTGPALTRLAHLMRAEEP